METSNDGSLKLEGLPIKIDIKNVNEMTNDQYIMARRGGFGASDSSILLGVNPYQKIPELLQSKMLTQVTEAERAVGEKTAVRKGRDLEPMIIGKASAVLGVDVIKPVDMYRFKEYPQLTINYDGVTDTPDQYIPVEIKVVTRAGEKHYNPSLAMYRESIGAFYEPPTDVSNTPLTIEQKAAHYGIPPYYYTQLNQEMMGLNAPYGYLAVLLDTTWELVIYWVWRDQPLLDNLIEISKYYFDEIEKAKTSDI